MEWRIRNRLYFTWLSGDHICERHVHNLDVINRAIGTHRIRAVSLGGRQVRTSKEHGHISDHFAIDLEYPDNVHVTSMCRQVPNCENNVSEAVAGTKGDWQSGGFVFRAVSETKRVREKGLNPCVQGHVDLIAGIREGKPLNELRQVAESTLTAIMNRMSTYTGKAVTREQALEPKQDLLPKDLIFGSLPVVPVAMPSETELA